MTMNTDKLIPISYVRKFTTLAKGDVIFSKSGGEYTISSRNSGYNRPYDGDNNIFVVSFAPRTNTGKQPVDGDVIVDIATENKCKYDKKPAENFKYWWTDGTIKTWTINYESMLAKFKEQGAIMNTDSNNHHIAITIEALGSRPVHHIDLAVTAVAVRDVREVDPDRSMGGPVSMPTFEFSEPTMTEAIMPDGERRTVGMVMCHEKPIYTQAMSDAEEFPLIGCKCQYVGGYDADAPGGKIVGRWDEGDQLEVVCYVSMPNSGVGSVPLYWNANKEEASTVRIDLIKPLDSRTDEEKAISDLDIAIDGRHTADVLDDIKADKITGVKWVGK